MLLVFGLEVAGTALGYVYRSQVCKIKLISFDCTEPEIRSGPGMSFWPKFQLREVLFVFIVLTRPHHCRIPAVSKQMTH